MSANKRIRELYASILAPGAIVRIRVNRENLVHRLLTELMRAAQAESVEARVVSLVQEGGVLYTKFDRQPTDDMWRIAFSYTAESRLMSEPKADAEPQAELVFVDFEASGLHPDSYPIEIGWCNVDGVGESHLIDPSDVEYWVQWDWNAEKNIHRISRELLKKEGAHPRIVADRVLEALAGKVMVSDAAGYDGHWMDMLFEAAGSDPRGLRMVNLQTLWKGVPLTDLYPLMRRCDDEAQRLVPGQAHRALVDAQRNAKLYELVTKELEKRKA